MNTPASQPAPMQKIRCAIYTRKSTDEGLDQEFNSLDSQRESGELYIQSQRGEGWFALPARYDDGGYSGGSMDRPALKQLMCDVEQHLIDCVVVYKVDRLSRSINDFCKIMDVFEQHHVTFVSVTQAFNTTTSMGRLTLNILLSFAQFEREVIGERIRDKIAALKRKGRYIGGHPILGYDINRNAGGLIVNEKEAQLTRHIFRRFLTLRSALKVSMELNNQGYSTKQWISNAGITHGGHKWSKSSVSALLNNRLYIGEIPHKGKYYKGEHTAIISNQLWDEVHAIFAQNPHSRASHSKATTPAMLQGIIRCAHCNCAMTRTHSKKGNNKYRYYTCVNASKRGYANCTVRSVSAPEVEKVVFAYIKKVFRAPELFAATTRSVTLEHKREVSRLTDRQSQTIQALARASHPHSDTSYYLKDQLSEITSRLHLLESHPISEADILRTLENIESVWDELFPAEQARIVSLIFHKILVYPDGIELFIRIDGLDSLIVELV